MRVPCLLEAPQHQGMNDFLAGGILYRLKELRDITGFQGFFSLGTRVHHPHDLVELQGIRLFVHPEEHGDSFGLECPQQLRWLQS